MTVLGILGGGQLGRMSALAAANLGIQTHIYAPEKDSPAAQVTAQFTIGDYADKDALKTFAASCNVISYEFENIPLDTIKFLETLKPVYPSSHVLAIAQDRIAEKSTFNQFGLPTTDWAAVHAPKDIIAVLNQWGDTHAIVKTTRFGYDGKGQSRVNIETAEQVWAKLKADVLIIERIVDFDVEVSAIVARDVRGNVGCFDIGLNVHKDSILHTTTIPCGLPNALQTQARNLAIDLAVKLDLVGVLGVELFVTKDGKILLNEIAPRPHNSGHWTMDGCVCSQFAQHVRSVCGMNLGSFARHSDALMLNLIGADIVETSRYLNDPTAVVHLYGKADPKPGRKMGHVNFIKSSKE